MKLDSFKVGDLVETCSMLPGHIVSIDGDNFDIKTPDGNISCHSFEHCGCHEVSKTYAEKCWKIGEERLKNSGTNPKTMTGIL